MKKLITAIALMLVVIIPASVLAETQTPKAANNDAAAITRIKAKADEEINRRVVTLTNLLLIVGQAKHISDADKTILANQIHTELVNLPTFKTKIDGDSELTTLKTDVQSIFTEFRVYALIVPKVHLVRVADRLSDASAKLTTYADKLQAHIDTAKTAGKDVTTLTATMTDMRNQILTAKNDGASVVSTIINLTPDQYNASPSIIGNLRQTLNSGREAAAKALKDGNSIRDGLKTLGQV